MCACDPSTLARDVAYLLERGYRVKEVQPLNMFPQTAHVEYIVKLGKISTGYRITGEKAKIKFIKAQRQPENYGKRLIPYKEQLYSDM